MALNPDRNTREEFTRSLIDEPVPANATPAFKKLWEDTTQLIDKLAHHEVMRPKLQQPKGQNAKTPTGGAKWDFAARTRAIMRAVNPSNPSTSRGDAHMDIVGRSTMTSMLIDDQDRQVDMMVNEPGDSEVQFGGDIVELAKQVGRDVNDL
ncbi:hypothetical protein CAC42_535 [Sphaceloma murrayae]|uniref:Uncharacterized protein n=1 Tax=Sphaceloma murrayae TaxID=2082308 RepID=A0A2K1R3T4_9PEZI|nr:hypothetical protein CAC42_535 [Sphaceloma murrayae]